MRKTLPDWRSDVFGVVVVYLMITMARPVTAQEAGTGALAGTVTDASGATVAFALVTATNLDTGKMRPEVTLTDGSYQISLTPGNYQVKFESAGYKTVEIPFARIGTETAVLDGTLQANAQTESTTTKASPQNPAPAAPQNPTEPSLKDLGFPTNDVQGNKQAQARLDKRAHMLKMHQRFGLVTAGLLAVTVITSTGAKGHHGLPGSASGRDLHSILGLATTDTYFTTAYFAIRAPKIAGTPTRGPIRVHKALAWIHGPGMILTPILGAMALSQENNGQKVHGIAKAHSLVATATYVSFAAAVLSVSIKF